MPTITTEPIKYCDLKLQRGTINMEGAEIFPSDISLVVKETTRSGSMFLPDGTLDSRGLMDNNDEEVELTLCFKYEHARKVLEVLRDVLV